MPGARKAVCRFAADRLRPRLRAFAAETGGVREGTDPEAVHRMRVASRRLRSALPLLASCLKRNVLKDLAREVRAVARTLGTARDTDVQLAFLDGYLKDLPGDAPGREELARVRAALQERRDAVQGAILAALEALAASETLERIAHAADEFLTGQDDHEGQGRSAVARFAAGRILAARNELLGKGEAVRNPVDTEGHHAMRIAAKKLRYTLELFRPLFPGRLRPFLRRIKRLQGILGEIHDCDVWIAYLPAFTGIEGPGPNQSTASFARGMDDAAGIHRLLADRHDRRAALYRQLVAEWDACTATSLWGRLAAALEYTDGDSPADGKRDGTGLELPAPLAALHPEGRAHARQVTRLAILLFDGLAPLHGFGAEERRLLGYAGLLHDIGWEHGRRGHHARSCGMILADTALPVTGRERRIIALVARFHRKAVPGGAGDLLTSLSREDRATTLALASLLRIADGLDYSQQGRTTSVSCTVGKRSVACRPVFDGDGTAERERALLKSDLFTRHFRREFRIP